MHWIAALLLLVAATAEPGPKGFAVLGPRPRPRLDPGVVVDRKLITDSLTDATPKTGNRAGNVPAVPLASRKLMVRRYILTSPSIVGLDTGTLPYYGTPVAAPPQSKSWREGFDAADKGKTAALSSRRLSCYVPDTVSACLARSNCNIKGDYCECMVPSYCPGYVAPEPKDCTGYWGGCRSTCKKTWYVSSSAKNGGKCPNQYKTQTCSGGSCRPPSSSSSSSSTSSASSSSVGKAPVDIVACKITDGSAPNDITCECGASKTVCDAETDNLCFAKSSTCSTYLACEITDGSAPNDITCECGASKTVCNVETNNLCFANTSTCSTYLACEITDGSAPNDITCECGASKTVCDVETDNLCFSKTSTCSTPACTVLDASRVNNAACICGGQKTCQGADGSGGEGLICNASAIKDQMCSRPSPCKYLDGLTANEEGCSCGSTDCVSARTTGMFCSASENRCTKIAVCQFDDQSAPNQERCACGLNNECDPTHDDQYSHTGAFWPDGASLPLSASNWSNDKIYRSGTEEGILNGIWGKEVQSVSTFITVPAVVGSSYSSLQIRLRFWALDSWDSGEKATLKANHKTIWSKTRSDARRCSGGWSLASADSGVPDPWDTDGKQKCFFDVDAKVELTAGVAGDVDVRVPISLHASLSQSSSGESWAFSKFHVLGQRKDGGSVCNAKTSTCRPKTCSHDSPAARNGSSCLRCPASNPYSFEGSKCGAEVVKVCQTSDEGCVAGPRTNTMTERQQCSRKLCEEQNNVYTDPSMFDKQYRGMHDHTCKSFEPPLDTAQYTQFFGNESADVPSLKVVTVGGVEINVSTAPLYGNGTCRQCSRQVSCRYGWCPTIYHDPMTRCSTCKAPELGGIKRYTDNCIPCPTEFQALMTDGTFLLVGLYCMFSTLYIVFRPRNSDSQRAAKARSDTAKDLKKVARPASALGNILVNQMQIMATILANIRWSPKLPEALKDLLIGLANIFSIDFAALMSSPDCAGDLMPKGKWLLAMMMPIGLAVIFLIWAASARHWLRNKPRLVREGIMQAILCAAVNVLLIGCYKSVVSKTFEIFDCDPPAKNGDPWILTMDSGPCPLLAGDPTTDGYGYLGLSMMIMYVILPFSCVAIQLWRYGRTGDLDRHINESYTYRVAVGWAVMPYKSRAYLWEPLNAVIKVGMVGGTVLLNTQNRTVAHSVIICANFLLHAIVRPFKSRNGNIIILLFCACDFFGIVTDAVERNGDPDANAVAIVAMQSVYASLLFLTLIFTLVALKRAIMPRIRKARAKLARAHKSFHKTTSVVPVVASKNDTGKDGDDSVERGEGDDEVERGVTLMSGQEAQRENMENMKKMSKCEIGMLLPYIIAMSVPLIVTTSVASALGRMIGCLARSITKNHINSVRTSATTKQNKSVAVYGRKMGGLLVALLYLPVVSLSAALWHSSMCGDYVDDETGETVGRCRDSVGAFWLVFGILTGCYVGFVLFIFAPCVLAWATCGRSQWTHKSVNVMRLAFLWPKYVILYIATYTYLREIVQTMCGMRVASMERTFWKYMYGRDHSPPLMWKKFTNDTEDKKRRDAEAAAALAKLTAEDAALLKKLREEYGAESKAYRSQLRKIQGLPPIPDVPVDTFELEVKTGPHKGKKYVGRLGDWERDVDEDGDRPSFHIGSSRGVEFRLNRDEAISGTHAQLTRISESDVIAWYLTDLDSSNGTKVRSPDGTVTVLGSEYDSDDSDLEIEDDCNEDSRICVVSGSTIVLGDSSEVVLRFGDSLNEAKSSAALVMGPICRTGKHTTTPCKLERAQDASEDEDEADILEPVTFTSVRGSHVEFRMNEEKSIDMVVNGEYRLEDIVTCRRESSSGLALCVESECGDGLTTKVPKESVLNLVLELFARSVIARRTECMCDKCGAVICKGDKRWYCEPCESNICFACHPNGDDGGLAGGRAPVRFESASKATVEFRMSTPKGYVEYLVNDIMQLQFLRECKRSGVMCLSGVSLTFVDKICGESSIIVPDEATADQVLALFGIAAVRMVLITSNPAGWAIRSTPSLDGDILKVFGRGSVVNVVNRIAGGTWLEIEGGGYCLRGHVGEGWTEESVSFVSEAGSLCKFQLNTTNPAGLDFYVNGQLMLRQLTTCITNFNSLRVDIAGTSLQEQHGKTYATSTSMCSHLPSREVVSKVNAIYTSSSRLQVPMRNATANQRDGFGTTNETTEQRCWRRIKRKLMLAAFFGVATFIIQLVTGR